MVAHPRKTSGPGPLRSITPGAITSRAITPGDTAPGAISTGAQSLQFRSLNLPVPIEVVEDGAGRPIFITLPPARSRPARSRRLAQEGRSLPSAPLKVASINDLWQVDDEWWRERPISRRYYQVTTQDPATQDERRLTIFRDQLNAQWHWQKGAMKLSANSGQQSAKSLQLPVVLSQPQHLSF